MEYTFIQTMPSAREIKVIEVKTTIGNGTKENPCRNVTAYYDLNGKLLATYDGFKEDSQ